MKEQMVSELAGPQLNLERRQSHESSQEKR